MYDYPSALLHPRALVSVLSRSLYLQSMGADLIVRSSLLASRNAYKQQRNPPKFLIESIVIRHKLKPLSNMASVSHSEMSYRTSESLAEVPPYSPLGSLESIVDDQGSLPAIDVGAVPGIVSCPDCNYYKRCASCDRGSTSTGIPCPNCGFINLN